MPDLVMSLPVKNPSKSARSQQGIIEVTHFHVVSGQKMPKKSLITT